MKNKNRELFKKELKEKLDKILNGDQFKDAFPEQVGDRLIFRGKGGYLNIPFKDFDEAMKKATRPVDTGGGLKQLDPKYKQKYIKPKNPFK